MGIRPAASSNGSGALRKAFFRAREWVFPLTRCVVCRRAAYDGLCSQCWKQLAFCREPKCLRCSLPLKETGLCGECFADEPPFVRAEYVALHKPPWAGAITGFKYAGAKTRARGLSRVAFQHSKPTGVFDGVDCLVPVPLHPVARVKRGFNQCELLCRELSFMTEIPWKRGLIRVKYSEPQVTLTAAQRRANVRGVFKARSARAVKGERVLLVDDVYTTGTTIKEAAKALVKGGAAEVRVLTLSRAALGTMPDHPAATGGDEFEDAMLQGHAF